jgi:PadR family transcriptional regulator PadR
MSAPPNDVLRGTLDLLVLKTLTLEPMHGWGISQRIEQLSRGTLDVHQGSLYPALQRLEQKGWIDSEWRTTENNRRAKYYRLTGAGRRALGDEAASWRRYVAAVELNLETPCSLTSWAGFPRRGRVAPCGCARSLNRAPSTSSRRPRSTSARG